MAGRKKKSELEVHHETEIKKIFSRQFRKACQKRFNTEKEIGTNELFQIYAYLFPEEAKLCTCKADKNSIVRGLRQWLNGETIPEYYTLIKLCEKDCLNCSLDYLLGRIECTNHDIQFIHDETGLSEESIKQVNFMYHSGSADLRKNITSLNRLLEKNSFAIFLLRDIANFFSKYREFEKGKELYKTEKKRRPQTSDIREEVELMESGYKPLITSKELAEREEKKNVALFYATNNFSKLIEETAKSIYPKQ